MVEKQPPDPDPGDLTDREIILQLVQKVEELQNEIKSLKEALENNYNSKNKQRIHNYQNSEPRQRSDSFNQAFPQLNLRPNYKQASNIIPTQLNTQATKTPLQLPPDPPNFTQTQSNYAL